MTISTTVRKTTPTAGNSSNKTWPFTFPVYADDEVVPYLIDSNGDAVEITADFTVARNADQQTSPGGTVTYPVAATAISSSYSVQIIRETANTQPLDLTFGGNFSEENVEHGLDRIEAQVQELAEAMARALRLRPHNTAGRDTEIPEGTTNYFLYATATGFSWGQPVAATVTIDAYVENNILNKASGAAILSEIGGIGLADNNVFTGKNDFQSTVSLYKGSNLTTADVAAGVLTLPDDGNYHVFTDATDFTEIATLGGNARILIHFSAGGNTLTHNAANLPLLSKADITTEADDIAEFTEYAAGDWRMTAYHRASGKPLAEDNSVVVRDSYRNLSITRPSVSTVTVTADELILQNSAGTPYRATSVNETASVATSGGANLLDTGSEAPSTWYHIWIIYNPTTDSVDSLLSTSSTFGGLTLPSGYTYAALIGAVYNDATPDFVDFTQVDNVVHFAAIQTIDTGLTTISWITATDVTAFYPPTAREIMGILASNGKDHGISTVSGGANAVAFRAGDAATGDIGGLLAAARNIIGSWVLPYAANLYVYVGSTSNELYATGWRY